MRAPRGLSAEEQAAWARLAGTVTPLEPRRIVTPAFIAPELPKAVMPRPVKQAPKGRIPAPLQPKKITPPPAPIDRAGGLDSSWERKLKSARIDPDFTLDLHGHTLDAAHMRLDRGLAQAKAMGARLVLVVTGKSRPVDAADRATKRGAIRAKILDWLAIGPHGSDIAAVRGAHRRHGGDGAIYIVLKRGR